MVRVQILEAVYISHGPNTLGNGIKPTILPIAMGKISKSD